MKHRKCPKCWKNKMKCCDSWKQNITIWKCDCGFSATSDYITGFWDGVVESPKGAVAKKPLDQRRTQ